MVRLSPLASQHIVITLDDTSVEDWWNDNWQEVLKFWEKNLPQTTPMPEHRSSSHREDND
jgi:hypothetical protein